jgi:proteasome lid subunit RPN8/RPN11
MIGADRLQTMEIHSENTFGIWSAPERPFGIEYSTRVLDDIRLAVTDAFFSLPRGGAEIGGVLLGTEEHGRVTVTESVPLPCEHAYGPSFVLSPRDHVALTELLAELKNNPKSIPVGWWHSHTRTEIFLSDADQEIHNRFFPEPWQVALVLKPHTFHPMRAGFFFREKDGSIRAASSYREFVVDALPMRAVPSSPGGPAAAPALSRPTKPNGSVITVASQTIEPLPPREAALPERSETPAPKFLADEPAPSRRRLLWVAAIAGLGIGAAAFGTRDTWLPFFQSDAPARLALTATDQDGQLQIRWDGASPAVRQASGGALVIADGPMPLIIPLDPAHLQSGSLTYGRKGDRVDVTLTVSLGSGRDVREATAFAGSAPTHSSATGTDPAVRAERDKLAAENQRLKADYGRQVLRTKELETGLEDLRKVIRRDQQRKRLEAQIPDTVK